MQTFAVHVLTPGFLTTVQDLGRQRYAHLGISASGAADSLSLRIGNLLLGNPENTAALEMTLLGCTLQFEEDTSIALTGSDFAAQVHGKPLPLWTPVPIKSGDLLQIGHTTTGARAYLCVRGGFQCPAFLGSVSTHLMTGLGGIEGRPLKKGDTLSVQRLLAKPPSSPSPSTRNFLRTIDERTLLRVTRGPQEDFFSRKARLAFLSSVYTVSEDSDRMGLRMNGPALTRTVDKEMLTEGVSLGAIQVPQSGQPIILFVEHQTTGGYPKIANVISADFHRLGQLRPRDEVRFESVSFERARELLRRQEALLNSHSIAPA